jgi:hypothetical protein
LGNFVRRLLLALVLALSVTASMSASPAQAVISHDPKGNLEYVGWNGSGVTVSGGAFDPDGTASAAQVLIRTGPLATSPLAAVVRTTILR